MPKPIIHTTDEVPPSFSEEENAELDALAEFSPGDQVDTRIYVEVSAGTPELWSAETDEEEPT